MSRIHYKGGHSIADLAEQQMRNWAIGMEIQERIEEVPSPERVPREIKPYVAISREAGAGGAEIAARLGEALSWPVFDRQLIEYIAGQYDLPRDMLEQIDEKATHWLTECLGQWISQRVVTQSEYIVHLSRVVLMAARHSSAVFVGRGAHCLLPWERGLSVHVVAPSEMRIKRTMELQHCDRDKAARYNKETDRHRRRFVLDYFSQNIGNPHLYDLIINRRNMTIPQAVELIEGLVRERFGAGEPAATAHMPR